MRFFVRFLAELGAPWTSELLDTLLRAEEMIMQKEQKIFTQFREKSSKFPVTVSNKIIIQKNFFHTHVSLSVWITGKSLLSYPKSELRR